MERGSAKLELRLIKQKLSSRISIAESLTKSGWNPKSMDLPPGERFLVIAPHPDDDSIGCGGTILKALASSKKVKVCYLSLPSADATSAAERLREVERSLGILGVADYSINKREFPESIDLVREAIQPELSNWKPDCVFVPSPLENHNQHLMTFKGYLDAMRDSPCQAATALFEVWGPVIPNLVIDITNFMEEKSKSIAAHASQVKMVDYVRMARAMNEYRAISSNLEGYAEAFLYLEKKDLLKSFP